MKSTLKKIIVGVLLGVLLAFPLGVNYGRGAPLLSNPFAQIDVTRSVKSSAVGVLENTREAIHDATRPADSENKPRQ